jgi:hypothetical protein
MRRLSGVILAGAILLLPALAPSVVAAQQAAPPKFTLDGDIALWSVSIRPDKTADYEQVLNRVKEALQKSEAPEAKQQLAGWRVIKAAKPMPDGNIVYTHVITPVAGADYNLLQVAYATITDPMQQKELYDLYRGAFVSNIGLASGTVVADFAK